MSKKKPAKENPRKRNPRGYASKMSRARVAASAKQAEAMKLRQEGLSYVAIAEKLGYRDRSGPRKAIEAAILATVQEPANELRKLELLRLDSLWATFYPLAIGGAVKAAELCLKIQARRSALEGLDAPVKLRHGGDSSAPPINVQGKHEHSIDPGRYAEAFAAFAETVLGEGMAAVREDGSLQPMDTAPAKPETGAVPSP